MSKKAMWVIDIPMKTDKSGKMITPNYGHFDIVDESTIQTHEELQAKESRNKELKEALEKADCMFQQIEDNVKKIPYYQEESDYFSRLDNIWKCISQAINQDKWRIK